MLQLQQETTNGHRKPTDEDETTCDEYGLQDVYHLGGSAYGGYNKSEEHAYNKCINETSACDTIDQKDPINSLDPIH